ncbi:MAG: phage holin [Clostridia bacterium]|nr:phage holin [Clostridia bacterium]
MNKINFKGVERSTWVRTAVLIIALVNQALVIFGITQNEADMDDLTYYISFIFTAISSVWSWWKNNSFTKKAQKADEAVVSAADAKG